MPDASENLIAAVQAAFPRGDAPSILVALDGYGSAPHESEVARVRLAIVALSEGNEEKLRHLVQVAKTDYRDILAWAQIGPLSAEEGEALQAEARRIIEHWGKK